MLCSVINFYQSAGPQSIKVHRSIARMKTYLQFAVH